MSSWRSSSASRRASTTFRCSSSIRVTDALAAPRRPSTSERPSSVDRTLATMPPGCSMAADETKVVPMPMSPIIWQALRVAAWRSPATPVDASPKKSSSATIPPKAMSMSALTSDFVLVNRSSSSEWLRRPSASLRLMMVSTSSLRPLPTSQATVA